MGSPKSYFESKDKASESANYKNSPVLVFRTVSFVSNQILIVLFYSLKKYYKICHNVTQKIN